MDEGTAGEGAVRERTARDWRAWVWVAAAVVFAFVIGFGWQGIRASQIEGRLDDTRQALTLHRLESSLAAATFEAQRGSYEIARQHASDFYTRLQQSLDGLPAVARQEFSAVLAGRDRMITLLSRGDPEASGALATAYGRYRTARERAEAELTRAP